METIKKNDFVEIKFSGYSNNQLFDSNIEEDFKKLNTDPKESPQPLIIVLGQKMVIPGLEKAIEGKELGKDYEVDISAKEGFGERRRELVKVIPMKVFLEKEIYPQAGMVLAMDNSLARIVAVSGGRVTTDFNNPLAGKDLHYKFKVVRKITEEKEKVEVLLKDTLRFVPEYTISDKITLKGPKSMQVFVTAAGKVFKELLGKDLALEVIEQKPGKEDHSNTHDHSAHNHDHNEHEHDHSHDHNHEGHDHHKHSH